MAKDLMFREDARRKLEQGVNHISRCVKRLLDQKVAMWY